MKAILREFSKKWMPESDIENLDWMEDANQAMLAQNPLRARSILYVMLALLLILTIWAAFASLDEVTKGQGKVIPSSQVQILQSLDGGVITGIHVREGDTVTPGQLLVSLDATRFESTFRENRAEIFALMVKAERLSAIANGTEFLVSEELRNDVPDVVAQESILFESSLRELNGELEIARQQLVQRQKELQEIQSRYDQAVKSYALVSQELEVTRPLVSSGAVSEVELLRLERETTNLLGEKEQSLAQIGRINSAILEAKGKEQDVTLKFLNRIREQLTEVTTRINSLKEAGSGLSDRVKQTEIRSTVRGTVKRLFYNTVGGVVTPGKEVIELVPLDDTLMLEARINPKDIAFLTPGQSALVKFTAYDFVVYGGLEALVEHIGADTVMDEEGNPFYLVRVRTIESNLGDDKPIIPGMVAEVDILTGKKTILEYLLKPVLRAKQNALTER